MIEHQGIDLRESCENEWLCSQIASAFGLPVAPCSIEYFGDTKVLVVKRFDREYSTDNKKILRYPQEDMCQALGFPSHLKYQSDGGPGIPEIMKLLLGSEQAHLDRELFLKSQVLFWLLAATDGHAKNFSIFIKAGGHIQLTPLYDILSTYPLMTQGQLQAQKIKMAMALRGKNYHYRWDQWVRRYFKQTAKISDYSDNLAEAILDEMLGQVPKVLNQVSTKIPKNFPSHISEPILEGIEKKASELSMDF